MESPERGQTNIKQEAIKSESTDLKSESTELTPIQLTTVELSMKTKKLDEQETAGHDGLEGGGEGVLGDANLPGEEEPEAETEESASPRSKTTATTPAKKLTSGSMTRSMRAQCRILYHRTPLTIPELANRYNRSQEYVKKIIANDAGKNRPDDLDEDYDYVDDETKAKYPPTAPEHDEVLEGEVGAEGEGEGEGEDEGGDEGEGANVPADSDLDDIPTEEPAPPSTPPASATPGKKALLKGVMNRADRAQCRILFHRAHIPLTTLAAQYNRSEDYIKRVLTNGATGKKGGDNVDEDYEHVDNATKIKYPPLPVPTKLKRKPSQTSISEPASRAVKKPRVSNTTQTQTPQTQPISSASMAQPSSSRGTFNSGGTPSQVRVQATKQSKGSSDKAQAASLPKPPRVSRAAMSSSSSVHTQTRVNSTSAPSSGVGGEFTDSDKFTLLPMFLASLAPPRPHLLAALTHQNFDDAFMRTIYTWRDAQVAELFAALSSDKVINATDAHLIRVCLRQQRDEDEA